LKEQLMHKLAKADSATTIGSVESAADFATEVVGLKVELGFAAVTPEVSV
jgi:hypothetical protein